MKVFGLKLNQLFFLLGGIGILISLPWFSGAGIWLWLAAQGVMVLGVAFVLLNK